MRPQIVKNILLFTAHFFVYGVAIAKQKAPPPPQRTPPGPGLPIDEGLVLVLIVGIVLGVYFILRKNNSNLQSR